MVAKNVKRYRWPLPYDPSAPPEPPMAEAPPSFQYTPPARFGQPPALADMPPITAEDAMAPQPETAYPQAAPELMPAAQEVANAPIPEELDWQGRQQQQLEEMRQEAEELKEMEKETDRLKRDTNLLKAQNAMAKAQEDKTKLTAPREGQVQAGTRKLKEQARRPSGREALSWRGGDRVTGRPASTGLQEYIIQGGTVPDLREIRQQAAQEQVLKEYAPQFIARPSGATGEDIAGLQAAHEERMAPILADLAGIRARREEYRRMSRPPSPWDVMQHKERVAEIKAGPPELAKTEEPRHRRGQQIDVLTGEIQDAMAELAEHDKNKLSFFGKDEWQTQRDEIVARLNSLYEESRGVAGLRGSALTEEIAMRILAEAGGDKEKARQIARKRGYSF